MPGFNTWQGATRTHAGLGCPDEAVEGSDYPDWLPEELRLFNVVRLSQSLVESWRKCPSSAVAEKRATYGEAAAKGIVAHSIVDGRIAHQGVFPEVDQEFYDAKFTELATAGWTPPDPIDFETASRAYADVLTDVYMTKYHQYTVEGTLETEAKGVLIWDVRDDASSDVDYVIITGSADLVIHHGVRSIGVDWKGLALDTKIPTTMGWKTMAQLQVGDVLYDATGAKTRVVGKSKMKNLRCFEVHFRNGETIVCDEEHLWSLSDGRVVGVQDLQPDDRITVVPMGTAGSCTHGQINPWVLGFWLGDGSARDGRVTKTEDSQCWTHLEALGYELGVPQRNHTKAVTRTVKGLVGHLRQQGQLNNKHIPASAINWLRGSRIALVQGLCDSDGTWNFTRGQCVWSSVDKIMADDMFSLVASLGEKPYRVSVPRKGFGLEVTEHRVCWTPRTFVPFRCEKADGVSLKSTWQNEAHSVKSVTEVPSVPTVCIKVDSPTSTFLCGEAMIPTHNTGAKMPEPWMVQRYGVQWRVYAVMFELDEMFFEYPLALNPLNGNKGDWVANRYKGVVACSANAHEREAFRRQLIAECLPIATALLRSTDPADHVIRPTDWHCSAKWCQRFAAGECMGQDHDVAWVAKSHLEAATAVGAIQTQRISTPTTNEG